MALAPTIKLVEDSNTSIQKYIIPVLAITAVGGIAYVGYKFLKSKELPKLETNPSFPPSSLTDAQALAIADKLYVAMQGTGTDEPAIMAALEGLTENDFLKVYEAFGHRQYSLFWGNVGDPLTSSEHHLITWLTNELDEAEIEEIQKVIPNLLSVKTQ